MRKKPIKGSVSSQQRVVRTPITFSATYEEPNMTDIHAHEVMHMMLEQDGVFSRESLAQAIIERFGSSARFHSCSADGMDVHAVIDFLETRGKFVSRDDGFNTEENKICDH
jgi:probable metal-binding protein